MTALTINLIDRTQLAEHLHCSTRQIDYLRNKVGLPYLRIGGMIRFEVPVVEAWLREQKDTRAKN